MKSVNWFILIACLLSVLSCNETSGFFLDLDEEVRMLTIEPGAVLTRGSEIPLVLEYNAKAVNPDNIVVEYVDKDGKSLGKTEIKRTVKSGDTLPSIIIPESFEPGRYSLIVRLREQEKLIKEQKIAFYIIDGDLVINNLTVYPPQLEPNGIAVIKADLSLPEGLDPWLRWRRGPIILMEGPFSKGSSTCHYTVPDSVGLYPVVLEIFPQKPESQTNPAWTSRAEVTVMNEIVGEAISLGRPENYHILFNFWGSLEDRGSSEGSSNGLLKINNARPDVVNGQYGLSLTSNTGLEFDYFLLPLEKGKLAPFTLTFHGSFLPSDKDVFLLDSADGSGLARFSIVINAGGFLTARWTTGGKTREMVLTKAPITLLSQKWISLNCYPDDNKFVLTWMIDGKTVQKERFPLDAELLDPGGRTAIGTVEGRDGVTGFLDELGVYSTNDRNQPSVDSNIFLFCQEYQYRNSLIFADGFDQSRKGNGWNISESRLVLSPEGSYESGIWNIPEGSGVIRFNIQRPDIDFSTGSKIEIKVKGVKAPLVVIDLNKRKLVSNGQSLPLNIRNDGGFEFYFKREGNNLLIKGEENESGIPVLLNSEQICFLIQSGGKKDVIILDDVLIIRN